MAHATKKSTRKKTGVKTARKSRTGKSALDIVNERFIEILDGNTSPWKVSRPQPLFKAANIETYLKNQSLYKGAVNGWLINSIPLVNSEMMDSATERYGEDLAYILSTKLVSKKFLTDHDIDPTTIDEKEKGMVYAPNVLSQWRDPQGKTFKASENGKDRYRPTKEEIKELSLTEHNQRTSYRYFKMYSLAQLPEVPQDILDLLSEELSNITPDLLSNYDIRLKGEEICHNLGMSLKLSGEATVGHFLKAFNSMSMPAIQSMESSEIWFEELIYAITEHVAIENNEILENAFKGQKITAEIRGIAAEVTKAEMMSQLGFETKIDIHRPEHKEKWKEIIKGNEKFLIGLASVQNKLIERITPIIVPAMTRTLGEDIVMDVSEDALLGLSESAPAPIEQAVEIVTDEPVTTSETMRHVANEAYAVEQTFEAPQEDSVPKELAEEEPVQRESRHKRSSIEDDIGCYI